VAFDSKNVLCEEIDNALNVQFTDSDNSLFDSDDSDVIDNILVQETVAIDETQNNDNGSLQDASASHCVARWEDMAPYVGQRDGDNYGP
jgi:hypothetical protein